MITATGLDRLAADGFSRLRGKRIGLLCNQASVDCDFRHIVNLLLPLHSSGWLEIAGVFGPQHGPFGHTQDNMIEWEGHRDARTGLTVHSLYGERREPTDAMLAGIDLFVVDVPDVGSRYYTFAWTMALCLGACARLGIPAVVLDRPNPIGALVEGPVLQAGFESFVGLYRVPTRHGMTIGEVANYVSDGGAEVVRLAGWSRTDSFEATGVPWVMPSPNMPTVDTAFVYPGGCLLEGTNLSEGRGTTRPFETVGAPFVDGWRLAESLGRLGLSGVAFRPVQFEPTFNKHAGRICEGVFVHVTDRSRFEPVLTYVAILHEVIRQTGMHVIEGEQDARFVAASAECNLPGFAWRRPPYEYEYEKLPFDILAGNAWLRSAIEVSTSLPEIRDRMAAECEAFAGTREGALLYAN